MAVFSVKDGYDHLITLLIIGEPGVGKSSLLSRFTKGMFSLDYKPTTVNNIVARHVYIDGKIVKAQIVDIAGIHRFCDFKTDIQMQNARGALIVYDVIRDSTFEEVEGWYRELCTADKELEIMLIANKTDLLLEMLMASNIIEAGKDFAERESLSFIDTSAKDDRNVEKAFAELVTKIFRKINITNDTIGTFDASSSPVISSEAWTSRSSGENEPAHYMLKVECFSFLSEAGTDVFKSDIFKAGGFKWRLELYPNGSEEENTRGYISIYVAICNTESFKRRWEVRIDAKFFVYDHVRQNYIIFQDGDLKRTRLHEKKTKWGFSKLMSLDSFTDAGNGFLFHDSCVIGTEVFVVPKYAEKDQCLSMTKPPAITNTHTWTINNFSAITEDKLYSDYFKVGKVKWNLSLYPKGTGKGKDTHLSIFLSVHDSDLLPIGCRVYAKYEIRLKNQNACSDEVTRDKHWFVPDAGWGTSRFILLSELRDMDKGFLLNDVLTVEVEFSFVGMLKDF